MHVTCIIPEIKKRIIIKDDILYRQYYNDIGEVSHLQVLLPGTITQGTTTIITWNSWQTPRNFKDDARNTLKIPLLFNCNLRYKLGS